jgi:hypothetical protein
VFVVSINWSFLRCADTCRLAEVQIYFMPSMAQKPEENLKKIRLRNKALDSLIPLDAEHVFRRRMPDVCWIENEHINLLENPFLDVFPLVDPNLFLSFVRLGARRGGQYKEPSKYRIKKWVGKYGLPLKKLRRQGTTRTPVRMPVEQFRREVRDAWELWTIHKEAWSNNAEAIMNRVNAPSYRWDYGLAAGFDTRDHKDRRTVARILYQPPSTPVINTAHAVLDELATDQLKDVRPRVHYSDLSWSCDDLPSALYLQFALLRMGDRPKRECKNCGTLFVLTRDDKYHCDETCYRTAYNHRNDDTS